MKLTEIGFFFFELLSILIYDELSMHSLSYLVKLNSLSQYRGAPCLSSYV